MNYRNLAGLSALVIAPFAAQANTVSAVSITQTSERLGPVVIAESVTDGNITVLGDNGSFATQNADGTSAVVAGSGGFFGEKSMTTSVASFTQSETNTTGADRDYTLSYSLGQQTAEFFTGFGGEFVARTLRTLRTAVLPTNPNNPFASGDPTALPVGFTNFAAASFEYNIMVNGVSLFTARADALLDGTSTSAGLIFDAVSGFTPASVSNGSGGWAFSVGAISGDFALGTLSDGESFVVKSSLTARAFTPGQGIDGPTISINTFSVDPVSLSSIGRLSSVPTPPVAPVPLPAAGLMLLAGLGGLAAVKRRQKA